MFKLKKFLISIFLGIILLASISVKYSNLYYSVYASEACNLPQKPIKLNVKGAIGIDSNSGQVLFDQNDNRVLPVASLSKLITIYLVLQAINNGRLSWNEKLIPDEQCVKISHDLNYSNVPLESGTGYTVRSLYQATIIYSADAAAMVLAKAVGGSEKNFVDMMRKQVKDFGINNAKIYTCNGLSNGDLQSYAYPGAPSDAVNELSAKDMAIIAKNLINKYPSVIDTSKLKTIDFNSGISLIKLDNWNKMLPGSICSYTQLPVDGLKTGTSDKAGACFIGTINKYGHRLITVVLGAPYVDGNGNSRFVQTQKMMSYIYHNFNYVYIRPYKKFNVYHGKCNFVLVKSNKKIGIWLDKNLDKKNIHIVSNIYKNKMKDHKLKAPLYKNEHLGNFIIKINDKNIDLINDNSLRLNAVSESNVNKSNIFEIIWSNLYHYFI